MRRGIGGRTVYVTIFYSKDLAVEGSGGENPQEGGGLVAPVLWLVANAHSPGGCAKATDNSETAPPPPPASPRLLFICKRNIRELDAFLLLFRKYVFILFGCVES